MTTYGEFADTIGEYRKTLAAEGAKAIATAMGVKAKEIAAKTAAGDLGGDAKFSGWKPTLDTRFDFLDEPGTIGFHPTRTGAGPWTVAERGRNQGNSSGFAGPGVSAKTGLTSKTKSGKLKKVKASKGQRWNGYTRGKNTATEATKAIEAAMPKVVEVELIKIVQKIFPGS